MPTPFIGREALDAGRLTRHELRSRFVAVYPGVYFAADAQLTARDRAKAAWLWSKRRGILAGRSAAAMHGTKWIDPWLPAEILHDNRHAPRLLRTWADAIGDDDVMVIDGIPVTTPARTALDMACRYPLDAAITAVDALANATRSEEDDRSRTARRPVQGQTRIKPRPPKFSTSSIRVPSLRGRPGCDYFSFVRAIRRRRHRFLFTTSSGC